MHCRMNVRWETRRGPHASPSLSCGTRMSAHSGREQRPQLTTAIKVCGAMLVVATPLCCTCVGGSDRGATTGWGTALPSSPPTVCGLTELNAASLSRAELELAFEKLRRTNRPVLLRGVAGQERDSLIHRHELVAMLGVAKVRVGTAAAIIGNAGEGPRAMLLGDYLDAIGGGGDDVAEESGLGHREMDRRDTGSALDDAAVTPPTTATQGVTVPLLYAFDRGRLWAQANHTTRARVLESFPLSLMPAHVNRTLPSVAGFSLEVEPGASSTPRGIDQDEAEHGSDGTNDTPASDSEVNNGWWRWLGVSESKDDIKGRATVPPSGHDVYFALGHNGTGVSFHFHAETMLLLHGGHKRWYLYPPDTRPVPRHHDPSGLSSGWAGVPSGGPDVSTYSEPLWVCDQQPGDAVYLPSGWHHATVNFGATFGVALQARVPSDELGRGRQLASGLVAARRLDDAAEVLSVLLHRWPSDPELLYTNGNALHLMAISVLDGAGPVGTKATDTAAARLLALSRASLAKALDVDAADDRAAIALCRTALEELQLDLPRDPGNDGGIAADAARGCRLAVRLNRHSHMAWFYAGRYAVASGDYAAAVMRFRRATVLDPTSMQSWYQLANSLMQSSAVSNNHNARSSSSSVASGSMSPLDEAVAAYERVVQLDPTLAAARLEYGILLHRLGRSDAARLHLKEAARLNTDLAPAAQQILSSIDRSDL